MPYQPNLNFKTSSGTDLGSLGWITKEYLMSVYPQIAGQMITPELWVWGNNYYGQLGINSVVGAISTPVTTLSGGANWKQVYSSPRSTYGIKTDGTLWTWGYNYSGELGIQDNVIYYKSTPVTTFAGGTNWKQVAGGYQSTYAIKTDGTLWTWGSNSYGQLGNNTTDRKYTPVTTFAGGTNWKQVAGAANTHKAAIKTDGTLWTWGRNYSGFGQLGINDSGTDRLTPVTTFAGGTNWKQVSCGYYHTAAIKTDGTLWTWGRNYYGPLGSNDATNRPTPVTTFAGGTNWKQVSCGSDFTSAIKTDGTLWTWGYNAYGQLGNNITTQRNTPVTTFAGGTNWKQVTSAFNSIAAIKTDGTLWTWGRNDYGQLGNNITPHRSTPVTTFAGGTNWKQVSFGNATIVAIKTSDDLQGI